MVRPQYSGGVGLLVAQQALEFDVWVYLLAMCWGALSNYDLISQLRSDEGGGASAYPVVEFCVDCEEFGYGDKSLCRLIGIYLVLEMPNSLRANGCSLRIHLWSAKRSIHIF